MIQMRPPMYVKGLDDLISYALQHLQEIQPKTLIEIGSYAGESTIQFAKQFNVISIDPFEANYDTRDIASTSDFEKVYQQFLINTKDLPVQHIRKTSDEAFLELLDKGEKVDMVYIDGLHTYDQVLKDIINYRRLVKPGGFIAGHDFHHQNWPGVVAAVQKLFLVPDKVFADTSWIVQI